MATFYDLHEAFQALCKATKKWGLYVSRQGDIEIEEDEKAVPYLSLDAHAQILLDGCGIILCDTEEEMETLYNQTVGDDGPTEANSYDGPARWYALTCDPNGQLINENT